MPPKLRKGHLKKILRGDENIIFSGCYAGKELVPLAQSLNPNGRIIVYDPWNTEQYPFDNILPQENLRKLGIHFRENILAAEEISNMEETVAFRPFGDLRNIELPSESMDLAVLNHVNFYDQADSDWIAYELQRVLKPNGRIIYSKVFMPPDSLEVELLKLGFKKENTTFCIYFPPCAVVEYRKQIPSNDNIIKAVEPSPYGNPFTPFDLTFSIPKSFYFTLSMATLIFFIFAGALVLIIYQYWAYFDIPKSIPLTVSTRIGTGLLCPQIIWIVYGAVETFIQIKSACRKGFITSNGQVFIEAYKMFFTIYFVNLIFQIIFYAPQVIGDIYLSKWVSDGVFNTISSVVLIFLFTFAYILFDKWQVKQRRKSRIGNEEKKPLLNVQ